MKTTRKKFFYSLSVLALLTLIIGAILDVYVWYTHHKPFTSDALIDSTTDIIVIAMLPLSFAFNSLIFYGINFYKWKVNSNNFTTFFFVTSLVLFFITTVLAPLYAFVSHIPEMETQLSSYNLICFLALCILAAPTYLDEYDQQQITSRIKDQLAISKDRKIPKIFLSDWTTSLTLGLFLLAIYPLTMKVLSYLYLLVWGNIFYSLVLIVIANIKLRRKLRGTPDPQNPHLTVYPKVPYPKELVLMTRINRIVSIPCIIITVLFAKEHLTTLT